MNGPPRKRVPANHTVTWDDLARHLALHINWLHRTAPKRTASHAKIDRWHQKLDSFPLASSSQREQSGEQR